jgi:hypothetical protein
MKYTVDKLKDLYTTMEELALLDGVDLDVFIPSGSLLLRNRLNLQFLTENLEKLGKSVIFDTDDSAGRELIAAFEGTSSSDYEGAYSTEEGSKKGVSPLARFTGVFSGLKLSKPKLSFPKMGLAVAVVFLALLVGGGFYAKQRLISSQKANIRVVIRSESMARSVTIRVDSSLDSDMSVSERSLRGNQVSYSTSKTIEAESTGERLEGKKAEGKVLIYNRTEDPISLSKGTKITFDSDDGDLSFGLEDGVTVPAHTYEDLEDPASVIIPGEASVDVVAEEIGSDYNIRSGRTLNFSGYKTSELVAKSDGAFEGGSSETVSFVSEEDIELAKASVKKGLEAAVSGKLEDSVSQGEAFITGSASYSYGDIDVSAEVDDPVESFTVSQSVTVTGLSYPEDTLSELAVLVLDEVVADGYVIFGEDHTINVEVLGSAGDYVLSSTAADLQVTIKTSVVPDLEIESLEEQLAGKSLEEAQRILGGMPNIRTYELKLTPSLPFSKNLPEDTSRILVEVEETDN